MKIRPVGAVLFLADRWTDRLDEANSRFSQLTYGLKKELIFSVHKYCVRGSGTGGREG
jgi:hypothetical protein